MSRTYTYEITDGGGESFDITIPFDNLVPPTTVDFFDADEGVYVSFVFVEPCD